MPVPRQQHCQKHHQHRHLPRFPTQRCSWLTVYAVGHCLGGGLRPSRTFLEADLSREQQQVLVPVNQVATGGRTTPAGDQIKAPLLVGRKRGSNGQNVFFLRKTRAVRPEALQARSLNEVAVTTHYFLRATSHHTVPSHTHAPSRSAVPLERTETYSSRQATNTVGAARRRGGEAEEPSASAAEPKTFRPSGGFGWRTNFVGQIIGPVERLQKFRS